MEKCRIRRNEKGAVLLTVLCVMLIMIILVGASISFVNTTSKKTYRTFQAEQAYMTASTCLETFVNKIEYDTNLSTNQALQKEAIDNLVALSEDNSGKGYEYDVLINDEADIERMGSCTIRVSKFNDSTIVITSTAKFGSEEEQVAAYVQTNTVPKKASFSNAIEICEDGTDHFDNLNVLGDMATITGTKVTSGSEAITYTLANNLKVNGSVIIYGNVKTNAQSNFLLRPGLSDSAEGGKAMIWGDFTIQNPFSCTTIVEKADTNDDNYILVKGTMSCTANPYIGNINDGGLEADDGSSNDRTNRNAVDVFCENFKFVNGYRQLGSLIVSGKASSTLTVDGHGEIYGDLIVDGKIDVKSGEIKVHGNVYCSGDIPDGIQVYGYHGTGAAKVANKKFPNADVPKTGRYKVPEMAATYNEYQYYPEDLIANPNSTVGVLKNKYNALHQADAPSVKSLYDTYNASFSTVTTAKSTVEQITQDGRKIYQVTDKTDGKVSKYAVYINKSCTLQDDLNSQLYSVAKEHKILVHVTTDDIVILLKEGAKLTDCGQTIVVKNDSSESSPKFCYFVTDAGATVKYDTPEHRAANSVKVTFDLQKSSVIDYELYKRMYTASTLLDYNKPLFNGTVDSNFKLNLTHETITEAPDAYRPPDEKIIYLFTNGSHFEKRLDGFHEGIIYGPECVYDVKVNNSVTIPEIYMSASNNVMKNVGLYNLGMVITGKFHSDNINYYAFNAPDASSALSIVKKSKESQLSGYKLIRYEHH